ncbi:MAG: PLP-dependent transferase [Alphaproteobacteria bacterium]|nr:PLP-dependent transferase [Alphaproteobacteria bacterium]
MGDSHDHDLTGLIHHPYRPPEGFDAPQPGVFKASTVYFPHVAALRARDWREKAGYTYGLHGTPTTYLLEERIAHLEGGKQTVLVPSGLSAISTTSLALFQSGDEVLIPDNAYGPNKAFAQGELARMGVSHAVYDPVDVNDLAQRIGARTRLVWLEAPGSVTMEFPDLLAQVRLCRERGVTMALDNTWGAGLAFRPFDLLGDGSLGVDISVHALTKYPSGGGDVLMGAITTCEKALHEKIKLCHMRLGLGVGANDVEAILRALPSIGVRYVAQDQSARAVAHWLAQQAFCAQVLHPAISGAPGHAHWATVCANGGHAARGLAAGLFSIIIRADRTQEQVDAFLNDLRCFKLGYSWGGPVSLAVPYTLKDMRGRPTPHLQSGHLVRLSMGLESPLALIADLAASAQTHLG